MGKYKDPDYKKKWREANREKCREYSHDWAANNKNKCATSAAMWQKAHPKEHGERQVKYRKNLRAKVVEALGGKCAQCGIDDTRVLQIDHVNGGGREELELFDSRTDYYRHVLSAIGTGNYQILCANCNWVKRYDNLECN